MATAILPITAGGAVAGMGATAGVLFALGVSKGAAVNFALASGLLLTCAALAAAVLGLGGSLLLTLRARRPLAAAIPARWAYVTKKCVAVGDVAPIAGLVQVGTQHKLKRQRAPLCGSAAHEPATRVRHPFQTSPQGLFTPSSLDVPERRRLYRDYVYLDGVRVQNPDPRPKSKVR